MLVGLSCMQGGEAAPGSRAAARARSRQMGTQLPVGPSTSVPAAAATEGGSSAQVC